MLFCIQDTNELRQELVRKEELIKRHYEKIAVWQNLFADLQGWAKSPAQGPAPSGLPNGNAVPQPPAPTTGAPPQPNMPSNMQQQLQQQQIQQQQIQQQIQQQQMQQQIQQQQMQQQVAYWGENTGQYGSVSPHNLFLLHYVIIYYASSYSLTSMPQVVMRAKCTIIDVFRNFTPCSTISTILENIPSASSGVLMLIGFHSRITMETLLLSFPIEGYY
jgi:exonuclease VII large subunit